MAPAPAPAPQHSFGFGVCRQPAPNRPALGQKFPHPPFFACANSNLQAGEIRCRETSSFTIQFISPSPLNTLVASVTSLNGWRSRQISAFEPQFVRQTSSVARPRDTAHRLRTHSHDIRKGEGSPAIGREAHHARKEKQ